MNTRKEIPPQFFIGVVVVLVLALGYFLWTRSSSPEPTIPPGQDIKHPFGNAKPGGAGRSGMGGVPASGTVDQRGMGPSAGAHIPR